MKKQINVTAVSAAVLLLFSLAVWFAIPYCIQEHTSATDIGPRAFPQLTCIAIAALSALQLLLLALKVQKGKYVEFSLTDQIPVYIAMALAVVAVISAAFINILVAGVLCSLAFLVLLRVKDWRYYLAVLITGGALFALMKFVMHIRF